MESFQSADAVVYGISPDKPEKLKKWKAKRSFQYDFLSDPDHQLLEQLGGWGEKSMYGKKYMGDAEASSTTRNAGDAPQPLVALHQGSSASPSG